MRGVPPPPKFLIPQGAGRAGRGLIAAALLGALALFGCESRDASPPIPEMFRSPLVGSQAPELSVRRWLDGENPLSREQERRARILLFWNADEPASEKALALVDSLATAHGAERLRVVTIHTSIGSEDFESPEARMQAARRRHPSLPTAIDEGNVSLRRYQLATVPSLVFVDADGTMRGLLENYRRSRDDDIAAFVERVLLAR